MWTTSPFVTRPDKEGVPLVLGFGRPRNTGTAVEGTPTSNSAAMAASGVARIDFFGAGLGSRQAMAGGAVDGTMRSTIGPRSLGEW